MGTLGPILSLLFLLFWSSFPGPSHQFPEPTPALPEILVSFSQLEFRVLACENPGLNKPFRPAPPTGSTLLPPAGWSSGVCKRVRGLAGSGVAVPATSPTVRACSPEPGVLPRCPGG